MLEVTKLSPEPYFLESFLGYLFRKSNIFKNDSAESATRFSSFFEHTSDFVSIVSLKAANPKYFAGLIMGHKFALDPKTAVCHFFPAVIVDFLFPDSSFLFLHVVDEFESTSVER